MSEEVKSEIMSWIKTIAFAVLLAFFITRVIIVNAEVPTGSMENNIMTGDRVVANRLAYIASDPKRFDIIVFKYPDDESKLYVKRIMGMPGETIEVIDGEVFIDGSEEPLDDRGYIKEEPYHPDAGPFEIPEGHYFMMGDNRNNSEDSRKWDSPFLEREKILGKVVFKYYKGIGLIK